MLRFSPNPNRAHLIPWQEWSDDAFRAARAENKPVMLFLSAFWCRYCQRMDEEAFSETENIALLNAYFISLRVENAQRPDVDARYNFHGWPTIAFMTPEGELLSVVNYLPPAEFQDILLRVYLAYQQQPVVAQDSAPVSTVVTGAPAIGINPASLDEITQSIMSLADYVNGGYDRGQKYIHPTVNDFLLERYEATKDERYLDQVCLTLDRMRAGEIYDHEGGAYFRTSSNADWSHPHREKLLMEEAGLLANCLAVYRVTRREQFRRMAEEIIQYLDAKLFDPASGAFFGCEDFLRNEKRVAAGGEFFTIIDHCLYTDANAIVSAAYLDAAELLKKPAYRERALIALEFLWQHCRSDSGGMSHYFDGAPHVPGLLQDQAQMGMALVRAHDATGDGMYLDRAQQMATFILTELKNPAGGFYDIRAQDSASLKLRLTLIEQNGAAASFFLALAGATGEEIYRDAALWAFQHVTDNFQENGIHAATLGRALQEYLHSHPRRQEEISIGRNLRRRRMPESLSDIFESTEPTLLTTGWGRAEGPLWHAEGYVTFVDLEGNRLLRWDSNGSVTVVRENTGEGNGCTLDRYGRLIMCEGADHRRITRMDENGAVTTIAERWQGKRFNKPNDVVCRSDGSIYFTDPGLRVSAELREIAFSGVFRIDPAGRVHLATDECEYPNGLAFSPDESILYVAISRLDERCFQEAERGEVCTHRRIRAFDVAADGTLSNNRVFCNMSSADPGVPDGIKVDTEGRVFCVGSGGIWVIAPSGEVIGIASMPDVVRNLAFGGPDFRTLYFTPRGSLCKLGVKTPGIGAFRLSPMNQ